MSGTAGRMGSTPYDPLYNIYAIVRKVGDSEEHPFRADPSQLRCTIRFAQVVVQRRFKIHLNGEDVKTVLSLLVPTEPATVSQVKI